jgi:transposase-like protein
MAFKQQVVGDLESGRFSSILAARAHYGIGGASTIRRWLARYGWNHLIPKVVRVETLDEAERMRELQRRIRDLEQALGRTQLERMLDESYLRLACEALGTDMGSFKKKAGTPRCTTPPVERAPG